MEEVFMNEAIRESKKAFNRGEIPIGAVIVYKNKIIARGYNRKENKKDATTHAEIVAIRKACRKLKDWRLNKCSIYVTMEPCVMCLGAIYEARIEKIVCGIENDKFHEINKKILDFNKQTIIFGVFGSEIRKNTKNFFNLIRNR